MNTKNRFLGLLRRLSALTLLSIATLPFAQTSTEAASTATEKATFAGGCFWCVESDFDKLPGVITTTSGYTGGQTPNPSYEQVSSHSTGHAEALQVVYDPAKVSYKQLVDYFWRHIDPPSKTNNFVTMARRTEPRFLRMALIS